jgi:hypothetical protein
MFSSLSFLSNSSFFSLRLAVIWSLIVSMWSFGSSNSRHSSFRRWKYEALNQ